MEDDGISSRRASRGVGIADRENMRPMPDISRLVFNELPLPTSSPVRAWAQSVTVKPFHDGVGLARRRHVLALSESQLFRDSLG